MPDPNQNPESQNLLPGIPPAKNYSEPLRQSLDDYRARNELTLSELARELTTNSTQVSKYLNRKPEGDVSKLEALIEDVLKNESRRRHSKNSLFATRISRAFTSACEIIRETNDIGLITGPAGIGKTAAISLYLAATPTTISLTASAWSRTASAMESSLFYALGTSGWKPNTKRANYLVTKLTGSNRLLIVDNVHRLSFGGLCWLFDFADATGCPVAMVGNPEVLDLIKKNDQMFSRIGYSKRIEIKPGKAGDMTRSLVQQLLPESSGEIDTLAESVAEHEGHLRAVKKQTLLARKIKENSENPIDWSGAFKAAHTQLIRDYAL